MSAEDPRIIVLSTIPVPEKVDSLMPSLLRAPAHAIRHNISGSCKEAKVELSKFLHPLLPKIKERSERQGLEYNLQNLVFGKDDIIWLTGLALQLASDVYEAERNPPSHNGGITKVS